MTAPAPASLAVAGWRTPAAVRLDLRYAPDEAEWLVPRPRVLWEEVVAGSRGLGADAAEQYPVDDPYGGERGAPVIASAFGVQLAPEQVTFGAGVTALLHGVSALVRGRTLVVPLLSHPDLEVWARVRGAGAPLVTGSRSVDGLMEAVDRAAPTVVQLDRPTFCGEVASPPVLQALGAAAARTGGVVIVDEAGANYLPPRESAVGLVGRIERLVVLRGFTKAYSLGGMRAGFAVASSGIAADVRAVLAPLQVGELAMRVVLRLLAAGDPCARLRERVWEVRPVVASMLGAAGLQVTAGHPDVPAVVVDDETGEASRQLGRRGICGLRPPVRDGGILQLRIPIGDARVALLRQLLRS